MTTPSHSKPGKVLRQRLRQAGLACFALACLTATPLAYAAPAANAVIGNQAAASYTDAAGLAQSATSNLVQTVVQQVGAFSLSGTTARSAAPGTTAYLAHTLTNTGNGNDAFTLQLANNTGTGFDFSAWALYLDADGNGVPDSTTPLATGNASMTTPTLAAGATYRFIVALTVPGSATDGQTDNVTVSASTTSASIYVSPTPTTLTTTATVTAAVSVPVFAVSKSVSLSQGVSSSASASCGTAFSAPGCTRLTYTLTYTNSGTGTGALYLSDEIGAGATAGLRYVPGSARWNTGTVLSDVADIETASGIAFEVSGSAGDAPRTLQAVIAGLAPGASGALSFDVGVVSTASVGTAGTSNTARFGTAAGIAVPGTPPATQATNVSAYTVAVRHSVAANTSTTDASDVADSDTSSSVNAVQAVGTVFPGSRIDFGAMQFWNTGNATDTFNIAVSAPTLPFPAGTVVSAVRADGTPFSDSNGDGIVDTGPVAAGARAAVHLRVSLPANACALVTCPSTAAMRLHVQAASVGSGSTVTNLVYAELPSGALRAPGVALSTTVAPSGSPSVPTLAANAGASVSFDLLVANNAVGSPADTYDLQYSSTSFSAGTVPAGWTITLRSGTCASGGTVITSAGPLAGNAGSSVCAVVTTSAGALAGDQDLYFRAVSANTGAVATLRARVTINAVAGLSLAPSNTGQLAAGGLLTYAHTLTNTGTVACTALGFTLNQSLSAQGWAAVVYHDVNGNGIIDSDDPVVTPGSFTAPLDTLAARTSRSFLVRVFAPGGAAVGAVDVLSFTVSGTCGTSTPTATATDRTTLMSGQLRLLKTQALDTRCRLGAGVGTVGSAASTRLDARPGDCVVYIVVATNQGAAAVADVTISDTVPPHTRLHTGHTAVSCTAGSVGSPGHGNTGSVTCSGITSIAAGASVTLVFAVQIDPS